MPDPIIAFIDFMRSAGVGPEDASQIVADDKPHRYRLEGDKPRTLNGSYCLKIEADGFAVGWARSFKEGETHKWHTKAPRKATAEEKAAHKARAEAAKRAREAREAEEAAKAAEKAQRAWKAAQRAGTTPYLERKGCGLHGCRVAGDALLVPMWRDGKLVGVQRIAPDGSKRFGAGTAKAGAYHAIKGSETLVIAEGFATAAAIHEATGYSAVVAFDAGNLKPVAEAMRRKYPEHRLVIAADNDQWTTRQDGTPWNPGVEKAQQAAAAVGGAPVVVPSVPADHPERPTDWDDVARIWGSEAVLDAFSMALAPREPEPEMGDTWEPVYDPDPVIGDDDPLRDIRPLGHNHGTYYFFPKSSGQITPLTAASLGSIQTLQRLAPRVFWETMFGDGDGGDRKICGFASAALMDACHRKGIYNPDGVRGVGAWIDNGNPIMHCGRVIMLPGGDRVAPCEYEGQAVYESGDPVFDPNSDPLGNREASALRDICRRLTWKKPQYGDLLAGWLVVAPVGSALRWRPHIWITGRAESGKSTVVDEIVKPVVGDIGIKRDGGTSEPGIRKALGTSGRPFILDEAEAETQHQQVDMAKILFLARRASSGGVVENANATFQVRSCFCFAAIIPRIEQVADKGRITQLELQRDERSDRSERYAKLLDDIHATLTPEFSRGLLARTVANLTTLLKNIDVFSKAATEVFGNRRSGDQIGPMLAGAYLLTTTKEVSLDDARAWIAKQNWDWHTSAYDDTDAGKLITHIMTARVRYDANGMSRESTVGDLVQHAADDRSALMDTATSALRPYGLRVKDGCLMVANVAPNLRRLLSETPYTTWARTLGDFPGAHNAGGKAIYFMPGLTSKVTALPLSGILGEDEPDEPEDVELPLEDWA